ncbi:LysM peptidoglycan-binding domain-containing protein [Lysinibacillus sp. NPDC097231]|uniref:cell division suppressor protein YneA n=1 Tax=Lysinibacillus sp. NPDC097231 TaxID=3364142 RepID=UPI00381F7113
MKFLKKNPHITTLLGACVLFAAYLFITDPGDVSYTEIEVEHGDSLWSLAEQYRGKMSTENWIKIVKAENELPNVKIIAGNSLVIPVVGGHSKPLNTIEIARNEK